MPDKAKVPAYIGPVPKEYALPTAVTLFVLIGLAGIISWSRLIITRQRPARAMAAWRWFAYTRVPWLDISLANAIGITAVFIAFFIYTFAFGQIYRAPKLSPAGLRAGYISIAMCPFVFTWGSRINPLAWLTRISHEKWMIYHQYGARMVLFFGLLHALLIVHSKYLIGGWDEVADYWSSRAIPSEFWNKKGLFVNGILALGTMVWMIFSSVFRHKSYEFFVLQHVISVLVVVVSLIAHLQVDLDVGIDYVYAFTAVWVFSVLVRFSYNVLSALGVSKWQGKATLREMPHGATAIEVAVKGKGSWKPGQHVYLRMPGLNIFQSHPFTIASATNPTLTDAPQTLRLLIKTRSGLTRKLARRAARSEPDSPHPRLRVILEGPYGHFAERLEGFDEILLIAGGVGGTYTWPIAEYLSEKKRAFKMVWTVRSASCLEWFADSRVDRQSVQVHISDPMYSSTTSSKTAVGSDSDFDAEAEKQKPVDTPSTTSAPTLPASGSSSSNASESDLEKVKEALPALSAGVQGGGRMSMTTVVNDFIADAAKGSRVAVLSCGPAAMLGDIGRAVVGTQWEIAMGRSDVREIWLHREAFGH